MNPPCVGSLELLALESDHDRVDCNLGQAYLEPRTSQGVRRNEPAVERKRGGRALRWNGLSGDECEPHTRGIGRTGDGDVAAGARFTAGATGAGDIRARRNERYLEEAARNRERLRPLSSYCARRDRVRARATGSNNSGSDSEYRQDRAHRQNLP